MDSGSEWTSCDAWKKNTLMVVGGQASCLVLLSHVFQLVLKPIVQPAPFAQILAGFLLGPSVLLRISAVRSVLSMETAGLSFKPMALVSRMILVFLVGLEVDTSFMQRRFKEAATIAGGGFGLCCVFVGALVPIAQVAMKEWSMHIVVVLYLSMAFTNTASLLVVRMVRDLKIGTTYTGQVMVYSALINDAICLIFLDLTVLMTDLSHGSFLERMALGAVCTGVVGGTMVGNRFMVEWLNRRNREQKYWKNAQFLLILAIIVGVAMFVEFAGYDSVIPCFLLGMCFPKGGKARRTLLQKLNSSVHIFFLPVYFGYIGFNADLTQLPSVSYFFLLTLMVLFTVSGKVCGALVAFRYLKIPFHEVEVIPFTISLKAYADLPFSAMRKPHAKGATMSLYNAVTATSSLINVAVLGPLITYMVKRDKSLRYAAAGLEWWGGGPTKTEVRILACVYSPRQVSTILWLIAVSTESNDKASNPHLVHLVELPENKHGGGTLLYHEEEEIDDISDEEDFGGNEALEVNDAVDAFVAETGITTRQLKVVCPKNRMQEEVWTKIEETRSTLLLMPFHKHQRIDGKMEGGKEGMRNTNQRVIRNAPCTAGILVDRAQAGAPHTIPDLQTLHNVALLFFGGQDDREALSYAIRISRHPLVNLTVIRFSPSPSSSPPSSSSSSSSSDPDSPLLPSSFSPTLPDHVSMQMPSPKPLHNHELSSDQAFLSLFYDRYVTTGEVGYVERHVENGRGTAAVLTDIGEMYTLFLVGKGGRAGSSTMTSGISDWEECPELGPVGDFLASSDFDPGGSVLVIQQLRNSTLNPPQPNPT